MAGIPLTIFRRRDSAPADVEVPCLEAGGQGHGAVVALTGTYHNLLRMWVEI
jgi:predicted 2-oxoglutarate/Fe(II)-dependent dioxygenase YbiX